ncbi:MAG: phage holin family protein [Candidatus Caenarcaniphilales bacterium]|nr:phage holin family protein [Candidatus Caenarcaniphilales bacterium]
MDLSQDEIIKIIISLLINSIVVFLIVKVLPGIKLKDFKSSIFVVVTYAILNTLITYAFNYFGLEEINRIVSQGVFLVLFNAVLIMIVDKFLDGLYVQNFWFALLASLVFTLVTSLIQQYVPISF